MVQMDPCADGSTQVLPLLVAEHIAGVQVPGLAHSSHMSETRQIAPTPRLEVKSEDVHRSLPPHAPAPRSTTMDAILTKLFPMYHPGGRLVASRAQQAALAAARVGGFIPWRSAERHHDVLCAVALSRLAFHLAFGRLVPGRETPPLARPLLDGGAPEVQGIL